MVEIKIMKVDEFSQKFKDFQQIFESDTWIDRSDKGLWILAILSSNEENDAIFYEEALETTDTRRFVLYKEGKVVIGEADYYIDADEIVRVIEEEVVLDPQRCVTVSLDSKEADFSLLEFIDKQKFYELQKAWKQQFGSSWLGSLKVSKENAVQRLNEAMDFWEERGFAVITRDYDTAECVAKLTNRKRVTVALPRKKYNDYVWSYHIRK